MKSKTTMAVVALCVSVGLATVIAQSGQQQDMGMMNMMGMTHDQCMQMMKKAGMSPGMMMRCSMMGALQVDPYDPAAVLAMKTELGLTADQQEKLAAIQAEARDKAKAILTEAQQSDIKPMMDTPNTMPRMWQEWHSKMDKQSGSAMMMCPWMGR